jgi:site-specific DNA recombinase
MSGPVRVALYTRISTDEINQPYSLGAQHDRLEAYVRSQPDWTITDVYTDQASGKNLDRPALTAARAAAAVGKFDILLFYRIDRLSRVLGDLIAVVGELQGKGVGLRSATETFDTSNPAGWLLVQVLGSVAEFERSTMLDRIRAGMERKAARGEWTGGVPPYGYQKARGESLLRPDPETAPVVRSIFGRYNQTRDGARSIADWLNGQGVRTRSGVPWSTSGVLSLLRNRAYIGEVSFRGIWGPSKHEPIVELDVFNAAQAILDQRAGSPGIRRTNPTDFLLSTLRIVCDRCGHPMVGASARGRGGKLYSYYTCSTRVRKGPKGCDQERLPKDELEQAVLKQMTEVYADTGLVSTALDDAQAETRAKDAERQAERDRLEAHVADLRRKINRYVAAFEAGELQASILQSRLGELQSDLSAAEAALAQEPPAGPAAVSVDTGLVSYGLSKALGEVLARRSPRLTKALLRVLIGEIRVVSPVDIRPTYRVPPDEVRILEGLVGEGGFEPPTGAV